MAQIHEEVVIIKLSRLVKNLEVSQENITPDNLQAIESIVQELVGDSIIVEVEKA